jgi:hypothetical protein
MMAGRPHGRSTAVVAPTICPLRDVDLEPVRSTIQGEAIGRDGGLPRTRM